jgi:hypothetical protein
MKKSWIILFSVLLSASVCFAEQAPVATPGSQTKVAETKKQEGAKKFAKQTGKKSEKKTRKTTETVKK